MKFFIRTTEKTGTATLYCRIQKRTPKLDLKASTEIKVDITAWNKAQKSIKAWSSYVTTEEGSRIHELINAIEQSVEYALKNGITVKGKLMFFIEGDKDNNAMVLAEAIRVITNKELLQRKKEYRNEVKVSANAKDNTFVAFVQQYILECESGERLKHDSVTPQRISASYIKNLKGFRNKILEYEKKKHVVLGFDDITMDFYKSFQNFFISKNYSPNTIARHMRDLKTIMRAALDLKKTDNREFLNRDFAAKGEEVDNVWLTDDQVQHMFSLQLDTYQDAVDLLDKVSISEDKKKSLQHALKRDIYRQNLRNARDIFIVGCLTGQRVSDYKRINAKMIEDLGDSGKFLHITQQKTGHEVYIPLDQRVDDILKRHGGHLPKMYDQHLNDHIKIVGLLCGWTQPANIQERRGLMQYNSGKAFYQCLMTHTARRTFATSWYKKEAPLSAIMNVTGHSSEQMLRRYLKLDSEDKGKFAALEFVKRGMNQVK